jgi:hypothetical protein
MPWIVSTATHRPSTKLREIGNSGARCRDSFRFGHVVDGGMAMCPPFNRRATSERRASRAPVLLATVTPLRRRRAPESSQQR